MLSGHAHVVPLAANHTLRRQHQASQPAALLSTYPLSYQPKWVNPNVQGRYQLLPRFAVSATLDQNGGFGFDALIKKTW
jgi:hypothetical protein